MGIVGGEPGLQGGIDLVNGNGTDVLEEVKCRLAGWGTPLKEVITVELPEGIARVDLQTLFEAHKLKPHKAGRVHPRIEASIHH